MAFNSIQFAVYLPVVCAVYFLIPYRFRNYWLLCASYYFYMSWNPKYVFLILLTTITSYTAARLLPRAEDEKKRKLILTLGILCSIACLVIFKYFNFLADNINSVLSAMHAGGRIELLNVILPVGISFYTFQTLSYIIDVYRGKLEAEKDFFLYALYVSFFPQLVAGPIERATNLLPQFREKHDFTIDRCSGGLRRILIGLFKKIVVADYFAIFINNTYDKVYEVSGIALIMASVLFPFQIYCDFSAYSDIAIGSAEILGFRLMENFRSPYLSGSFSEFWRRWHISLSTWLQDYIFVPLVWSRWWDKLFHKKTLDDRKPAVIPHLIILVLVSGIWHGAGWTFVCWGLLHGIYRAVEELLNRKKKGKKKKKKSGVVSVPAVICVFALNAFSLIFFRASSIREALYVITHLFHDFDVVHAMTKLQDVGIIHYWQAFLIALLIGAVLLWDIVNIKGQGFSRFKSLRTWQRYAVYYILGLAVMFRIFTSFSDIAIEFIYFQF